MSSFAENTSVPVGRTRAEIEALLQRHGASRTAIMLTATQAEVFFTIGGWSVRFRMPLPARDEQRFTHVTKWRRRATGAAERLWEQGCRSAWRALLLTIKAKLVGVESKVETFEEAFLAHIVSRDGSTVGDQLLPRLRDEVKALPSGLPS